METCLDGSADHRTVRTVHSGMPPRVSVIICTRNPRADYFSRCIDGLRRQTLPLSQWEIVLVDNASDPPASSRFDLSWHPSLRSVIEPKVGLTPARLLGIREAAGELLVFVDDDNVLAPDFLEQAWAVAEERGFLGAWSGQCRPDFERPPPEWTRRYWGNLSIREFENDVWSNLPRLPASMPCGAGLCVRRAAARHYLGLHDAGQRAIQLDRTGDALLSGGDNDLAACACDLGLGVGLISALKLDHLIPPGRLTERYLNQLTEGIYFSSVILAYSRRAWPELASYRVRWTELVRAALTPRPHRGIQFSALRGRHRGRRFLAAANLALSDADRG
jgi:glycosyltransferase involved in cell wall biosynthesis